MNINCCIFHLSVFEKVVTARVEIDLRKKMKYSTIQPIKNTGLDFIIKDLQNVFFIIIRCVVLTKQLTFMKNSR